MEMWDNRGMEAAVYIVIRRDLKMRRGKEIAQGIHASAKLGYAEGLPVIVVQAADEAHLGAILAEAQASRVPFAVTADAGRTEVAPGTWTAAALGPVAKGALPLLAAAQLY